MKEFLIIKYSWCSFSGCSRSRRSTGRPGMFHKLQYYTCYQNSVTDYSDELERIKCQRSVTHLYFRDLQVPKERQERAASWWVIGDWSAGFWLSFRAEFVCWGTKISLSGWNHKCSSGKSEKKLLKRNFGCNFSADKRLFLYVFPYRVMKANQEREDRYVHQTKHHNHITALQPDWIFVSWYNSCCYSDPAAVCFTASSFGSRSVKQQTTATPFPPVYHPIPPVDLWEYI